MKVESEVDTGDGFSVDVVPVGTDAAVLPGPPAQALAQRLLEVLDGARIWHVNSTATGGGVAELLHGSISRHQLLGLPCEWLVSNAPAEFFALTKRIHHGLHGSPKGWTFSQPDASLYGVAAERQADGLLAHIREGDLVVLHDPQTLGAAPRLADAGARVAWRSHIGTTRSRVGTAQAWSLLRPYLKGVRQSVFTMPGYAPSFLETGRWRVIQPSIDPCSAKNRELSPAESAVQLAQIGLTPPTEPSPPVTAQTSLGRVIQETTLPADVPVVLQVSRWDPLKDMAGVLEAFVTHIADHTEAHLVLAGPDPADIPDDPEGHAIFKQVLNGYERVPYPLRARIHIALLSLRDTETNALIVNALQRRATVVTQKSTEEGFGLTITEAMWKGRPVVATRVGGIPSQINSTEVGVLIDDPADLKAFGHAVVSLLHEPHRAERIGVAAHHRCAAEFMVDRELCDYFNLYLAMPHQQ